MPTTSNFGWTTPADTDLVKDGAAAIRTLGNGIDTSLVDLKGGTTGQVLSKNSNTDLDYTWVTPNVGDITEVQAGTGISVASGTGPIPVVTNTVATAYDAKGDLIVGTGADTFAKLTVGTNGHTLVADSSTATGLKWAAPADGGKVLQVVSSTTTTQKNIASTTLTDTNITATITPTSASSKILIIISAHHYISRATNFVHSSAIVLRGATTILNYNVDVGNHFSHLGLTGPTTVAKTSIFGINFLDSPATTSATTYKLQARCATTNDASTINFQQEGYPSTITLMEIGA